MSVIVLLADGARPDTVATAIDRGDLPELGRMREEGGLFTITSCFPSVTGPAYTPFLMGRYPGPLGLPGLRWYDRARRACGFPNFSRSYVGYQMQAVDRDLDPDVPTIFELCSSAVGALSVISRGLPPSAQIGRITLRSVLRAARTHFSGDLRGWLEIDREIGAQVTARVRRERPEFVFAAMTGVDKTSHAAGQEGPLVAEALRIVDDIATEIRFDAERGGYWPDTHVWVASDHGHSSVLEHEDLAGWVTAQGFRVLAHPWVVSRAPDVAVMVSGNAMAHLYVELTRRARPYWPTLAARWEPLAEQLLRRPSIDLLLLPTGAGSCEVRAARRGSATVTQAGGRFSYRRDNGDPLGIGRDLDSAHTVEAYEATITTDYPDAIVQIASLAGADRAGDLILSAARNWDLRSRYEPIPHKSAHGALHREHMLAPLLLSSPPAVPPRRTVDVMPSALSALGRATPSGLDGQSFFAR